MTVIGARPQFIKAAPVSKAIRKYTTEILIHTGQHYDHNMSRIFFDDMGIPVPDANLEVGSGPHGQQTGLMLERIEDRLKESVPDLVLVYGDTNSTLAGALAAVKMEIPVCHIEAGLRSYNRKMPEEINRILADRCADLLCCPTETAVRNLQAEGIQKNVYLTGDVMYDAALHFRDIAVRQSGIMKRLQLKEKEYVLCTLHRAENTDSVGRLTNIVNALIDSEAVIVLPVHPRTEKMLLQSRLMERVKKNGHITMIPAISYLDMIRLEMSAGKIVTDSGGVQKEAYFFDIPCITLRDETEWTETVSDGWNCLAGARYEKILDAIHSFHPVSKKYSHYGNGRAADIIAGHIARFLSIT